MTIPLGITSYKVAQESHLEYKAQQVVQKWLNQTSFDLIKLDAKKNHLELVITGSGEVPPLPDFGKDLHVKIDKKTRVRRRVISFRIVLYPESIPK